MSVTNLFIPLLVGIVAFWTYLYPKNDNPTGEIICTCSLVVAGISLICFAVNAPWFLNLAILSLVLFPKSR